MGDTASTVDSTVYEMDDDSTVASFKADLLPIGFAVAGRIQGVSWGKSLTCLFDSGSTGTWLNKKSMPKGMHGYTVEKTTGSTLAGTFTSTEQVCINDVILPEYNSKRVLPKMPAKVFTADCRYDIIIGRDMLRAFGMKLDFELCEITCANITRAMREFPKSKDDLLPVDILLQEYLDDMEDDDEDDDDSTSDDLYAEMMDSKYEGTTPAEVAQSCKHLTQEQRDDLEKLLSKFDKLFDGKLRKFTDEKIHLEVDPNVPSHRSRPYTVPFSQRELFRRELNRLVSIGVLEKCGRADWVSGTFCIPKKDGRIRWVSDFRALNKALKRKFYPLPKIQEILTRRKGYKFLSKLDLSMQYYTFELDDESAEYCTIATPFGLYRYRRLPMGVSAAPAFFLH